MVQGPGPSARYAHTLALVANRFLVAMGGNDGKQTLADAWALDTSDKPYQWRRITDAGDTPLPRCARPAPPAALLPGRGAGHWQDVLLWCRSAHAAATCLSVPL